MTPEESKTKQLIKIAETLPYLPDLSFRIGNYWKVYKKQSNFIRKSGEAKKSLLQHLTEELFMLQIMDGHI